MPAMQGDRDNDGEDVDMKKEKIWFEKPLLLDFDGVIHGYKKGEPFGFNMDDPVVPGAAEFIERAGKHFRMCVYSARSAIPYSRKMMQHYLETNGIDPTKLDWPIYKPAAWLTIDDRCLRFEGKFPSVKEMLDFKAWCE